MEKNQSYNNLSTEDILVYEGQEILYNRNLNATLIPATM